MGDNTGTAAGDSETVPEQLVGDAARETGLPVHLVHSFYERVAMGADPYSVAEALAIPVEKAEKLYSLLAGAKPLVRGRRTATGYPEELREKLYEEIKELYLAGVPKSGIAGILGVSTRTVDKALEHYGVQARRRTLHRDREELYRKIRELYAKGYSKNKIKMMLHVSWETICKALGGGGEKTSAEHGDKHQQGKSVVVELPDDEEDGEQGNYAGARTIYIGGGGGSIRVRGGDEVRIVVGGVTIVFRGIGVITVVVGEHGSR